MSQLTSSPSRRGRPPAEQSGQVDGRVLDAATALFLELGFGRTTLDRVAQTAQTGKSSVYRRYRDKQKLFAAVVERSINQMFADLKPLPPGGTVTDRLRHAGRELIRASLVPRCVAFMRITAAEATSFPELATMAYEVSFKGAIRYVLVALEPLSDSVIQTGLSLTTRLIVARRFIEVAVQPSSFQAAFGVKQDCLVERAESDVEDAIWLLKSNRYLGKLECSWNPRTE